MYELVFHCIIILLRTEYLRLLMKIKNKSGTSKKITLIASSLLLLISVVLMIYSYISISKFDANNLQAVKSQQSNLLAITSDSIDQKFGNMANLVNMYAESISQNTISARDIGNLLYKDPAINDRNVLGVSVLFLNEHNQIKRDRLYWQFQSSQFISTHYTTSIKPEQQWLQVYQHLQNHWSRPYYDSILKQYIISYTSLFYVPNSKKIAGIIVLDLDLRSITNLVARNIGEKFTTLATTDGFYINDIDSNKIVSRINLANSSLPIDANIYVKQKQTPCNNVCNYSPIVNGNSYYVMYKQMANLPWIIFAKYTDSELHALVRNTNNPMIMLQIGATVLSLLSTILIVTALTIRRHNFLRVVWACCLLISLLCSLGTIYTWNISRHLYFMNNYDAITSDVNLQQLLQPYYLDARQRNIGKIIEIPTAIQVDSVEFLTAYNLQVTGMVMQVYPKEFTVNDGICFNNSFDTKLLKISDINSTFYHTVIWTFQTKIREDFDYQHYPFNRGTIWLSLSPFNSESNLVFTPNFAYYNGLSDINANYGVNNNVIIPGWHINGSFFNFISDKSRMLDEIDSYDTIKLPSLTFNMIINSSISDAIITTIIPPTVIIFILFTLLLTISKYKNKFIEFKVNGIIGACGGMLFTIVFTHVSLRNKLTSEMMYIEYIYLIMYIVVLLIPINSLLFATKKSKFIWYGNNLFFKLLFIPVLTVFVFVMTLLSFSS